MKRLAMEVVIVEDGGLVQFAIFRAGANPRKERGKVDQGTTPFEPAVLDELRKMFNELLQQ